MNILTPILVNGVALQNYPLAQHTSWRVGGAADFCFQPNSAAELQSALAQIPESEEPFFLGLGSNTLIRDGGIPGYVILTRGLGRLSQLSEEGLIYAETGVSCATLARFAARQGLGGLEFLAGIPGTVGGALAMNAGANGSETWEFVDSLEMINQAGKVMQRFPPEFAVEYRKARGLPKEWFLGATFKCKKISKEASLSLIKEYLDRRQKTQPINLANCGCVFVNPVGAYAGNLIERAGLKGVHIGDAWVSDLHANFIVNQGQACASDIEALIKYVSDVVFEKFKIRLQTEVKIVGQQGFKDDQFGING